MDDTTHKGPESMSETKLHDSSPPNNQVPGAFFPNAQNFVVAGGTFKSVTNIRRAMPAEPPDFQIVSMGDLNLRHEIRLNAETGIPNLRPQCGPSRRVYSARIHGFKSKMTVAIYEGDNAEEDWRETILRYSNFRHPNIIQLFGIVRASTNMIHATIFHDELIPARQMLQERYRVSTLGTIYFWHFLGSKFNDARWYMYSVSGKWPKRGDCTLWIRMSTRDFCVDFSPSDFSSGIFLGRVLLTVDPASHGSLLLDAKQDTKMVASMSLRDYHRICRHNLSLHRWFLISTESSVRPGTVNRFSKLEYSSPIEIAFIPDWRVIHREWNVGKKRVILENGWTRITSAEVQDTYCCTMWCHSWSAQEWLSQANHVFNCLDIETDYEEYAFVERVWYQLRLSGRFNTHARGYLFLCPLQDLQADEPARFRHPDCPAFWSLDPSGAQRLRTEEAGNLGFPFLELEMMAWGYCWDTRVYAGLRQFHKAKGFEPCSQDLARHLGHPLFQLSSGVEAPFVYAQEIGSSSDVIESLHDEPIHEFTTNKFRYLQLLGLTSLTKVQWMVLLLVSLSVFLKLWL